MQVGVRRETPNPSIVRLRVGVRFAHPRLPGYFETGSNNLFCPHLSSLCAGTGQLKFRTDMRLRYPTEPGPERGDRDRPLFGLIHPGQGDCGWNARRTRFLTKKNRTSGRRSGLEQASVPEGKCEARSHSFCPGNCAPAVAVRHVLSSPWSPSWLS
jgi:hypothetical protein